MASTDDIMKQCFLTTQPSLKLQVHYLLTHPEDYLAALQTLSTKGILSTVSQATKARILVALHVTKKHATFSSFLNKCDVVEIYKACEILDRNRLMRQIAKKIASIESAHPHLKEMEPDNENAQPQKRRRKGAIHTLRRRLKELKGMEEDTGTSRYCPEALNKTAVKELLDSASVSGALAMKVRKWARKHKPDFLEFIVMSGSIAIWAKLADMVHFSPSEFSLPYFLSAAHGVPAPKGSFVRAMQCLTDAPSEELGETFVKMAEEHPQVYKSFTYLRTIPRLLQNQRIAQNLAHNIPLDTAIWYLEELCQSPKHAVANILAQRLQMNPAWMDQETSGNTKVSTSFAKLVERIKVAHSISPALANALMPAAERRLGALREEIMSMPGDTLTIGDASASMQTAINAATIFASMVSVCWDGDLCFFSSEHIASPHRRPKTVEQVLEITHKIRANNCTAVAAGLAPAYEARQVYARIVLVTDEYENTNWRNYNGRSFQFPKLLRAYMDEVNPHVELVLVGVGSGERRFQESLRRYEIPFTRVEIDEYRPDLTKFDALLRQLTVTASAAPEREEKEVEEFILVEEDEDVEMRQD